MLDSMVVRSFLPSRLCEPCLSFFCVRVLLLLFSLLFPAYEKHKHKSVIVLEEISPFLVLYSCHQYKTHNETMT
jgi:hypothetical protein